MASHIDKLKQKNSHLGTLIEMADTISKEHNESKDIQVSFIDCKSRLYDEHVQLQSISKLINRVAESTKSPLMKKFLETCVSAIDSINLDTLLDDLTSNVESSEPRMSLLLSENQSQEAEYLNRWVGRPVT